MIYYRRLFCNNSFFRLFLILLVVLSYILPSKVNAQIYDVRIHGNPEVIISPNSDFSGALDQAQIQGGIWNATGTGPQDTRWEGAGALYTSFSHEDYEDNSATQLPYNSNNDVLKPKYSGRNPLGLTGKYFDFSSTSWLWSTNKTYDVKTPQQEHWFYDNEKHPVTAGEYRILPTKTSFGFFFKYDQFTSDVISAIIGSDNFQFMVRFIDALNATPSVANFTFTVPATFGFTTGFTINIPFHDILHGSGSWASFSTVISFFRSFVSFLYYYAVIVVICRAIYRYQ